MQSSLIYNVEFSLIISNYVTTDMTLINKNIEKLLLWRSKLDNLLDISKTNPLSKEICKERCKEICKETLLSMRCQQVLSGAANNGNSTVAHGSCNGIGYTVCVPTLQIAPRALPRPPAL